MIAARVLVALVAIAIPGADASCARLPGKPLEAERWKPPSQVTDFGQLYGQNCAGCHGTGGRLGAARSLNDPLYLAFAGADVLRQVTAKGAPGTAMPGFAQQAGGKLTDRQIDLLVEGMIAQWGRPGDFKSVAIPPYRSEAAGDPQRGGAAYQTYCARCHGADGGGGPSSGASRAGGAITDPNYLALVSDQSLRTTIVAGRTDLGMPDWRGYISGQPMSAQEISDVVAWLASKRPAPASAPDKPDGKEATRFR